MNRNTIYLRVLMVVISIVVVLAFINHSPPRARGDTWLPSSFNPVGAGHMAFFQTLEEMHWPVERWREPLSRLSTYGTGNVLLITRSAFGSRVSFSPQEIDLLDDWVRQGNTLLLLGALNDGEDTRQLLRQIGFNLPEKSTSLTDFFPPFDSATPPTLEIHPTSANRLNVNLLWPAAPPLPLPLPAGARVLWESGGQPYVIAVPRGAGHILCGASASWLSNRWLGQGDNLTAALSLLAPSGRIPRHLFFEESHHGFSAVYAVARLLDDHGVRFAGMLALLGVLAFFGSSLVRFGPVVPLQRETGRSTLEFVDSIADLYLRADLRNDTLKYLFLETHQRVLLRLNLPPTAPHDLISSRLRQAHPQLPSWKKLAQRFDSRDYTEGLPPGGWLRVARELIEIKSALA
jgi:hypothetical protein